MFYFDLGGFVAYPGIKNVNFIYYFVLVSLIDGDCNNVFAVAELAHKNKSVYLIF